MMVDAPRTATITYDADKVARAVVTRSGEQKWSPQQTLVVSMICDWHVTRPEARIGYEDGQPGADMRDMVDSIARDAHTDASTVLSSFGAAHCLLCDVVPGFRPVLFSAWHRDAPGAAVTA